MSMATIDSVALSPWWNEMAKAFVLMGCKLGTEKSIISELKSIEKNNRFLLL